MTEVVIPKIDGWKWKNKSPRKQGIVTLRGREAYFKTIHSVHRGEAPYGGFELIAWQLARFLRLPVPDYFYGKSRDGQMGVGSFLIPGPAKAWKNLPNDLLHVKLLNKFKDPSWFAGLLVFDTFIGNTDRSIGNLLFQPLEHRPWGLCLIDHNHMFRRAEWLQTYNKEQHEAPIDQFIKKENPKLAELYGIILAGKPQLLKPYIKRVERLHNRHIQQVVAHVPAAFMSPEDARTTRRILRARRDSIRIRFCDYL